MEIKLTDVGLDSHYTFYNTLLRYNIRTVSDLLDDSKTSGILERCQRTTREELLGFIDLVKHEVYGSPLPADLYLEQIFEPMENHQLDRNSRANNSTFMYLLRMGFTSSEALVIYDFYNHRFANKENIRIIDVLEYVLGSFANRDTKRKIRIYLNIYKNKDGEVIIDQLKKQLGILVENRDKLNEKISLMEQKIQALEEAKGSVKK